MQAAQTFVSVDTERRSDAYRRDYRAAQQALMDARREIRELREQFRAYVSAVASGLPRDQLLEIERELLR